jgi:hypothetical protein
MGSETNGRGLEGFPARAYAHFRANVVGYLALFVALGGTTYAATGGNFILGKSNSASSQSSLSAPISNTALQLINMSTGGSASALGLSVASGHPPLRVNSDTKVPNLNADKLDGQDSSAFASFKRIVLVRAGGSAAANGSALRSALAGIGDASSSNPYLVKVEPGVYDLGSTPLQMKAHVDVEGSGIDATTLTGANASNADGVVDGAASSELRFLTVNNTGVATNSSRANAIFDSGNFFRLTEVAADSSGTPNPSAIAISGAGAITLDDVHASASGTTANGQARGILLNDAQQATLTNVVATAQNANSGNVGVNLTGTSSATLTEVTAAGQGLFPPTYGMFVGGGGVTSSVTARDSLFSGSTNSIATNGGGNTAKVGASELNGTVSVASGDSVNCAQVYTATFTETAANTCP